jgi:hypothetical protein
MDDYIAAQQHNAMVARQWESRYDSCLHALVEMEKERKDLRRQVYAAKH